MSVVLPKPPHRHFWRIVPGVYGYIGDAVELRRKTLFWSRSVWGMRVDGTHRRSATPDEVLATAHTILASLEKTKIYGDYPPKSFKEVSA